MDVSVYRAAYERGWRASQRYGLSTSYQVLTPLERADMRGEFPAWYDGYHDHAADRPKWWSLEGLTRHQSMPKGGMACTAPAHLLSVLDPDAVTCGTCLIVLDYWRSGQEPARAGYWISLAAEVETYGDASRNAGGGPYAEGSALL